VRSELAVAHAPSEIVTPARTISRCIDHPLPRIRHLPFLFELFLKPARALAGSAMCDISPA